MRARSLIITGFISIVAILVALIPISAKIIHAASADCVQPPTNVDHASFTDAQLDQYGLPHRSANQSLDNWQQVVRDAKVRVCTTTTTNQYHHPGGTTQYAAASSPNWSGYESYGYGYSNVVGQWNVPCLTLRLTWGVAGQWVGIGGDGNNGGGNLIQAGTETDEDSNFPGHWYQSSYAWYEDFPSQGIQSVFGVNCGDTIYSDIWQDSSAHFYVSDWTSGQYFNKSSSSNLANGSTAEWIVERTGSSTTSTLSDFRYVNFTQCFSIRYGSATSIANSPYFNINMVGKSGSTDASPGSLGNDSSDIGNNFTDSWHAGN